MYKIIIFAVWKRLILLLIWTALILQSQKNVQKCKDCIHGSSVIFVNIKYNLHLFGIKPHKNELRGKLESLIHNFCY